MPAPLVFDLLAAAPGLRLPLAQGRLIVPPARAARENPQRRKAGDRKTHGGNPRPGSRTRGRLEEELCSITIRVFRIAFNKYAAISHAGAVQTGVIGDIHPAVYPGRRALPYLMIAWIMLY